MKAYSRESGRGQLRGEVAAQYPGRRAAWLLPRIVCPSRMRLWFWFLAAFLAGTIMAKAQDASFPLHVAADGRHLEDAGGRPFLVTGDAAWSLIAELTREEAEEYLQQRRRQGFNTLLVSLLEHKFSRKAPRNIYGDAPFLAGKEFEEPNEAYFKHADWVLQRANELGFLVLLTPAYLGSQGGDEGWYQAMKRVGVPTLHAYGEYLGRRYARLPNIVWVNGGDYDPANRALVAAVASGLASTNPSALQTAHGDPETSIDEFWGGAKWLSFDTVYTYRDVAQESLRRYLRGTKMPFVLIESRYENEGADEEKIRQIAYGALLSGAAGQVFGNSPVWHFSGPGVQGNFGDWRAALGSPGARSISYLKKLFDTLSWWKLVPDQGKLAGRGENVVCARADDGSFALVYITGDKAVSLDLEAISTSTLKARWYDPSSGTYTGASAMLETSGTTRFEVPAPKNKAGYSDWVLVVGGAG
ncbi:collagenase-like protein with putative collagen-binding domain [Rhizobium sp. BK251]|nr:collagenase-like protein with putative collagen-binding domain [Rhizobium sp. BK251]